MFKIRPSTNNNTVDLVRVSQLNKTINVLYFNCCLFVFLENLSKSLIVNCNA